MAHLHRATSVEVWPENWPTFTAYRRICEQWIVGPVGIVDLNLCAVYPLLDRMFSDEREWLRALDDIKAMADAVAQDLRARSGNT